MARSRRPSGVADVGLLDNAFGFLRVQHVFGQAVVHARQDDFRSRVVQQIVLAGQPLEEALDGLQARVLRANAERLAVLFAVMKEPALIAFEHGPRDLAGFSRPRSRHQSWK